MRGKVTIVLIMALALLMGVTGCSGKKETVSSAEVPQTQEKQFVVQESFKDFDGDQLAKVSGNRDVKHKLSMSKGTYLFRVKSEDPYDALKRVYMGASLFSSSGAGLDSSGWTMYETLQQWYSEGEFELEISTEGAYEIEIYKLPLSDVAETLPMTKNLLGTRVIGPFAADNEIRVKIVTEDARNAGFNVELYDAGSGERIRNLYLNYDSETKSGINEIDTEVVVDVSGTGEYFLAVICNGRCSWEVSVTN